MCIVLGGVCCVHIDSVWWAVRVWHTSVFSLHGHSIPGLAQMWWGQCGFGGVHLKSTSQGTLWSAPREKGTFHREQHLMRTFIHFQQWLNEFHSFSNGWSNHQQTQHGLTAAFKACRGTFTAASTL